MESPRPDGTDERTIIARSESPASLRVGSALINGTYVIDAYLASGGMGEIYRATHSYEGDQYAIKIIKPAFATDETAVELFRREARDLKRVNNDAIVRYRDIVRAENGALCLIMEYVDGASLAEVLRDRRFDPPEVLALLRRIGQGLVAVHDMGIVHRDISPDNVILPSGGIDRAKLIDFGIAKSLDTSDRTLIGSDFAGKYSFVSPEQVDPGRFGQVVDHRSDIYSLGLVLAAAAIGFGGKLEMGGAPANVLRARQSVPDLSSLPESLRPLIAHMLQPQPQDRPASMREVLDQLDPGSRQEDGRPPTVTVPPPRESRPKPRRKNVLWAGGAALVAALCAAAFAEFGNRLTAPSLQQVHRELAAATAGYQCADLSFSANAARQVRVSGYVANEHDLTRLRGAVDALSGLGKLDFAVQRRAWPYCEAAAVLKPFLDRGSQGPAISLSAESGNAQPSVGGQLGLDVRAPNFDSYVYIDYFRADGRVTHLYPDAKYQLNLRPARNHFILGQSLMPDCWTFAGDPGQQMITLTAARRPLFDAAPQPVENAKDYLQRLKAALASAADATPAAAMLFYDLQPGHPAGTRCPAG